MLTLLVKYTRQAFLIALTIGSAYAQCPVTAPNSDFTSPDAGAPGCTPDTYKPEGQVTTSSTCATFTGTTCGLIWYTTSYSLNCPFCVTFDFNLSTATSDGIALSMANFSNTQFPCSTPIGCSEGGNIGYNNINTSNANIEGALTIEVDVFDNSADGDDDPTCNHVSVVANGDNSTSEAQACEPGGVTWDDGATHALEMCWDPASDQLTVNIDGTGLITLNSDIIVDYFGGNTDVHFAFSSGYNSFFVGTNTVCNWTVQPLGTVGIELHNFSAERDHNSYVLKWATTEEIDNSHFEVQRSTDGVSFEKIGKVEGWGNTNELIEYSFTDENPKAGQNFYRLVQVDIDGKKTTYKTESVFFDAKHDISTRIVNGKLHVNGISNEGEYEVNLYNTRGQPVLSTMVSRTDNTISLPVKSGVYLVSIEHNGVIALEKVAFINE